MTSALESAVFDCLAHGGEGQLGDDLASAIDSATLDVGMSKEDAREEILGVISCLQTSAEALLL